MGAGVLGPSLIAKAGAFAPRFAGAVSQAREDVNQPRHEHTHLSPPRVQGRPQGRRFGPSFCQAVKLENAHEEFYGRCPFRQRCLDRDDRVAGDASCAARAGSEPGGYQGFRRLRSRLASRPLWRLPTAVQLPSGMAHGAVRTALLPQLVGNLRTHRRFPGGFNDSRDCGNTRAARRWLGTRRHTRRTSRRLARREIVASERSFDRARC